MVEERGRTYSLDNLDLAAGVCLEDLLLKRNCSLFGADIVDCHVAAFSGEFETNGCSQSSVVAVLARCS